MTPASQLLLITFTTSGCAQHACHTSLPRTFWPCGAATWSRGSREPDLSRRAPEPDPLITQHPAIMLENTTASALRTKLRSRPSTPWRSSPGQPSADNFSRRCLGLATFTQNERSIIVCNLHSINLHIHDADPSHTFVPPGSIVFGPLRLILHARKFQQVLPLHLGFAAASAVLLLAGTAAAVLKLSPTRFRWRLPLLLVAATAA